MIQSIFWLEPVLIFVLILANGFFAAAEIAIIATRKSRIDALLEKGVNAAAAVARLKNDPDRFLATVQIGVTVVSSFASAIGGAAAIGYLEAADSKLCRFRSLLAGRNSSLFSSSSCRFPICRWSSASSFRSRWRSVFQSASPASPPQLIDFLSRISFAFGKGSNGVQQCHALDFRRQRNRRSQLYLGR